MNMLKEELQLEVFVSKHKWLIRKKTGRSVKLTKNAKENIFIKTE